MNSFEMLSREKKAAKLADLIGAWLLAADVRDFGDDEWHLAAAGAGVKPPSETTRKVVIALLEAREAAQRAAGVIN